MHVVAQALLEDAATQVIGLPQPRLSKRSSASLMRAFVAAWRTVLEALAASARIKKCTTQCYTSVRQSGTQNGTQWPLFRH